MTVTLKADGNTGKVVIWTGEGSAPYDDPIANLGSVKFSSTFTYPAIESIVSGSVTLNAIGANTGGRPGSEILRTYNLFSHGKAGTPLVFGVLTNIHTRPVALTGSVPVQMNAYYFGRWVTLGADATNVMLHEQSVTWRNAGIGALTLNYTIYVCDLLL